MTPYNQGQKAFLDGLLEESNPHLGDHLGPDFPNPEAESWAVGWRQAKEGEEQDGALARALDSHTISTNAFPPS